MSTKDKKKSIKLNLTSSDAQSKKEFAKLLKASITPRKSKKK